MGILWVLGIHLEILIPFLNKSNLLSILKRFAFLSLLLTFKTDGLLLNPPKRLFQNPPSRNFQKSKKKKMDENTKKFLSLIGQLESSGGKNVAHRTIASGMHSGDNAFGTYGLMPNTTKMVANKLNRLNKLDEDTQPLYNLPKDEINQYMDAHPNAEEKAANFLARNILARMHGDELKSAYAWNQGSELKPEQITPEMMQNSQYVQRYKALQELAKQEALKKLYSQR